MRIFKEGNWEDGLVCPFCKSNDTGEVVLVPIYEKYIEGSNNVEAKQIHSKCIADRWIYSEAKTAILIS